MAQARIDERYYNESTYFEGARHLQDFGSRFQRYRVRMVLSLHSPSPADRVLDLGCGWGTITFAMAPLAQEVVGLDFSGKAIASCNERLAGTDLTNVRFVESDARKTGLDAGSQDVVVAADLFEHLYPDDSMAVAREAGRVLAPGGRFVVWTPCRSHILEVLKNNDVLLKRDVSHVDYKSMARLKELLAAAGLEIEKSYYAPSHLPGLAVVERLGQRWLPTLRRRIAVLGRKPEAAS